MQRFKFVSVILFAITLLFTTVSTASALDRRVTIKNNTGYTIVRFYGSNTGRDDWEEDILGRDVIPAGGSMRINFDDGSGYCMFDFKAVFNDGDVLVKKRVNVCKVGTFNYN